MAESDIDVEEAGSSELIPVATDKIGLKHYPVYKQAYGAAGVATFVDESNPLPARLFDGFGNPLSSYFNAVTGEYILSIHDADVHNQVVNKHVHQHTLIQTILTANTAADGTVYEVDVADATGFTVGDALHINTTSVETTHPTLLATTAATGPATFTLDRRLDVAHFIDDTVTKSFINMAPQVGTLADPQEYFGGPEDGQIFHITRILFEMTHDASGDLGKFGGIAALTNGVVIRAKVNGRYGTLTNWKNNGDIKTDMFDVVFDVRSGGQGDFGTSGRGTIKETGAVLRLDSAQGDKLEVYIQDDISGLTSFKMKMQGHVEGS